MIVAGHVAVNGEPCTAPNRKLRVGDTLTLEIPEAEDPEPMPEDIALEILHEDEHLIVINKPAGMVVHPAPGNWTGTLVNALIFHCGAGLKGIGGVRRPGIVHRLDRNTSGVMVAAKTQPAHAGLAAQFADHGRNGPLVRAYLAIVWGTPPRLTGTISAPIGRSPSNRTRQAVVSTDATGAREAATHYRVLKQFGGRPGDPAAETALSSLVECTLETGRTHQIRVHMAHIGTPLIGDKEYGAHFATKVNLLREPAREIARRFPRQALHAAILGFEHPVTGEKLRFEVPLPSDMALLAKALEQSA